MSTFRVYYNGQWHTPPAAAMPAAVGSPRLDYPPIVRRHEPTARSGAGYPVQTNAELWAEVGRPVISASGAAWWYSTIGIGSAPYVTRYVTLYDPITGTWKNYQGYIWQPTYTAARAGYYLLDFRVRITNLVEGSP